MVFREKPYCLKSVTVEYFYYLNVKEKSTPSLTLPVYSKCFWFNIFNFGEHCAVKLYCGCWKYWSVKSK